MRETAKMVDVICMEFQRSAEEGAAGSNTYEHTSTITDTSNEDENSAAEVQQLLIDHQKFEDEAQEARQEESVEQDDGNSDSGTYTDLPSLVGRHRDEFSSDNSTTDGSYDYHTDNNNSSIEGSDDESSNTVPGLQERRRVFSSSDEDSVESKDHDCDHTPAITHVPQSINTRLIVPPWMYTSVDEDDYDTDRDDDDMSTQAREMTVPLQMRGGGIPVVETVTKEDTEEGIEELK